MIPKHGTLDSNVCFYYRVFFLFSPTIHHLLRFSHLSDCDTFTSLRLGQALVRLPRRRRALLLLVRHRAALRTHVHDRRRHRLLREPHQQHLLLHKERPQPRWGGAQKSENMLLVPCGHPKLLVIRKDQSLLSFYSPAAGMSFNVVNHRDGTTLDYFVVKHDKLIETLLNL